MPKDNRPRSLQPAELPPDDSLATSPGSHGAAAERPKKKRRWGFKRLLLFAVGGIVLIVIISGALSSSGDDGESAANDQVPAPAVAPTTAAPATTAADAGTAGTAADVPVDIDFAGTGNAVEFVTLTEGRWVVESSVKGNEGELGIGAEFTVKLLDSDGGLCDFVALAMGAEANESSVIKVGDGLFDLFDCAPGELALEIDAVGDWVVTFTKR